MGGNFRIFSIFSAFLCLFAIFNLFFPDFFLQTPQLTFSQLLFQETQNRLANKKKTLRKTITFVCQEADLPKSMILRCLVVPVLLNLTNRKEETLAARDSFIPKWATFMRNPLLNLLHTKIFRHILFNDFLHKNHIRSIVTIRPRHSAYYFFSFSKKCLQMHKCGGQSWYYSHWQRQTTKILRNTVRKLVVGGKEKNLKIT